MVHVIWDDRRYHGPGIYYSRWEQGYVTPDSSISALDMIGSCRLPYWEDWYPNVCINGDYAFASGSNFIADSRIQIINKSNPTSPVVINTFDNTHYPDEMTAYGNFLYIAWSTDGALVTYDVSNPLNPVLSSVVNRENGSPALCKRDTLVYLINAGDLVIYNVVNPVQPLLIAVFDSLTEGYALNDVDVSNGIACLIASGKLFIIDVSDPARPVLRSRYTIDEAMTDGLKVAIKDGYAYIITYSPEVEIVDISDPTHPIHAAWYYLNFGNAYNLVLHDNYLLVAHNDLTVADISNPLNPTTIAEYDGTLEFYDVDTDDNYIYADSPDSFVVFQLPTVGIRNDNSPSLRRQSLLMQNFPNPFNAGTSIKYSLSQTGPVTISIYNLLGQKVATLSDGNQPAGEHSIIWNAGDFTSGVYFARLQAAGETRNIKMVLLK
jgi:hypothetical protein